MKKLILVLLFIPIVCFGQEDIERYKVYNTTNNYTSLLLDSATGQIWQLQIGLTDVDQLKSVLSDTKLAETLEDYTQQYNEAEIYLLESFSFMREKRGIKDRFTKNVISSIIKLYKAWGKPDKVKEYEALLPDTTDVSH